MIAAQTDADWRMEQVAQALGYSRSTLRRHLAKEQTNFQDLLTDVRMMRALTLLQVTDWAVSRIAYEVGYHSPSRFTARFKERFGYLPVDIRQSHIALRPVQQDISVGLRP